MNKLIETAKELDRILESGIEILPNSPIHEKLKQALNIACVNKCTCVIPDKQTKVSENGIHAYCRKCFKSVASVFD